MMRTRRTDIPALAQGVHRGIEWRVTLSMPKDCANGYVRLPFGHPWFGITVCGKLDDLATVHDRFSYADEEGWIGFSTGGTWDQWSADALMQIGGVFSSWQQHQAEQGMLADDAVGRNIMWTRDKVVTETKRLAELAAAAMAVGS